MSFQIRSIVLYSKLGKQRVLAINPGEVNIITGASKTGKSALIPIVDYCLGSSKCEIPERTIRDNVSWVGLVIVKAAKYYFISRKVPEPANNSSEEVYFEPLDQYRIPEFVDLKQTFNVNSLIAVISNLAEIGLNSHLPDERYTRRPLTATIRHALWFCFQKQNELSSNAKLFHKQDDSFCEQALKDVLPYFLKAVTNDYVAQQESLRALKRQRKLIQREIFEYESIKEGGVSKAQALYVEAIESGLLTPSEVPRDFTEYIKVLKSVVEIPSDHFDEPKSDNNQLEALQYENKQIRREIRDVIALIEEIRSLYNGSNDYLNSISEHIDRLSAVGCFTSEKCNQCPLCNSVIESGSIPDLKTLSNAMRELETTSSKVSQSNPQIEKYINELEGKKRNLQVQLTDNQSKIKSIEELDAVFKANSHLIAKQAYTLGRVKLYLESYIEMDQNPKLGLELKKIEEQIEDIDSSLSIESVKDRVDSIISLLNTRISEMAVKLKLEHSDSPFRFDANKLTIYADTLDRPIPFSSMGSGETWVGVHIIVHLALHILFVQKSSPVPRFLFIDQPSQVYFPEDKADAEGESVGRSDEDRKSVIRMFQLIIDVVKELDPDFQVIVTDHARFNDKWFEERIRERWRNGNALIPREWLVR